jgi:C1A family cysteine protease
MTKSDLRNWLSSIRDQGQCGSCVAHGIIGAWEGCIRIKENIINDPIDISERDLFFCAGGSCSSGSYMDSALNHAVDPGVCLEECCPYNGVDHSCGEGRCDNWWTTGKKLKSWREVRNKEEMKSLLNSTPLVSTMMVHQSFINYKSGVYHSLGLGDPILGGHCIGIVGYDDDLGAWLVRNSWGTDWGMEGNAWVKYGDSEIDSCMYQLEPDGEIPPQPTPPNPSPCIIGRGICRILNFFVSLLKRKGRFTYINPRRE